MNEEFLPYEESLVLKELGFDEPCFGVYSLQGSPDAELCYGNNIFTNTDKVEVLCSDECTAILYQQAFKFFKDNYDLWFRPDYYDETRTGYSGSIHVLGKYSSLKNIEEQESAEKAEFECIRELIKIVKK